MKTLLIFVVFRQDLPSSSAYLTGDELRAEYKGFQDGDKFREYILSRSISLEQLRGTCSFEATTFGTPREPLDFVRRAVETGHPHSLAIHLSHDRHKSWKRTSMVIFIV